MQHLVAGVRLLKHVLPPAPLAMRREERKASTLLTRMHADKKLPGFSEPEAAIPNIHPDHNAAPISIIKVGKKGKL
jgi:carbamate kinase